MNNEIANQEMELMSLKGNQTISGSALRMYKTVSDNYTFVISENTYFGSKLISFRMSKGYHYVTASINKATYVNSTLGINGTKSRVVINLWQLPQDGSGIIKFMVGASQEPTLYGTETVSVSVVVVSDEKGVFS